MATDQQPNGADLLSRIHEALACVHTPHSTNDSRRQALMFLESVKADPEAPYHGYTLAFSKEQQPVIRHYALSLLEYAIKHSWPDYSESQAITVREWVLQLSQSIIDDDPIYIRNKIAQLWVEIGKRSWAAEWTDMDELLVRLWGLQGTVVHKEFVLFVLETLSDEVFNGEDPVAAMREGVLSKACVEIFTPAPVLAEAFPNRHVTIRVRHGEEGWLVRLGELLKECLVADISGNHQYQSCALKILAVYKSVMPWAIPRAIASSQSVQYMCKSLAVPLASVQLAAVESLHALYSRVHFADKEFLAIVCPMYTSEMVELLRKLFEWSAVDPLNIDDEKYLFAKKFSEMMSNLATFIEQKFLALPEPCDLANMLRLLLSIAQSPSLVVSIPILASCTKLLRNASISASPALSPLMCPLLELCSSRLIRYESMPEDYEDTSLIFLLEDIDTIPERHAFLGNYRRCCSQVIELMVRQKSSDALYYILNQVDKALDNLYDGQPAFSPDTFSKSATPVLRADTQFTVVESALKGFIKWRASSMQKGPSNDQQQEDMEGFLETWCKGLLNRNLQDPLMRKRIIQLAVFLSTNALHSRPGFMLQILEHILMERSAEPSNNNSYLDAVRDLQIDGGYELQRLARQMPDHLLNVYDQLEAKVNELAASGTVDLKRQTSYRAFLMTIIHRSEDIEPALRIQKLKPFTDPLQAAWRDPKLAEALTTSNGFCDLLSLNKVTEYLVSRKAHEISDWGTYALDGEGRAIQEELEERSKALPLQPTKTFLASSTEKIERGSLAYQICCSLWHDALPIILPNLLQFLSHAHAFHNPDGWIGLPTEMRPVVGRILADRFWQSGISGESKDNFYARVAETKTTMEGFASSIRGCVRSVRESCYSIMWCMSRLDVAFYGFKELPGPLAHALFADAHHLSSHQLISLMHVVRTMVEECPVHLREHFVPPLLATCFAQMDAKCSTEWEKLSHKQIAPADANNLKEEMKEESILRQLTHTAVMMVAGLLDPAKDGKDGNSNGTTQSYPSMRHFCLRNATLLEPLLVFYMHAIRMRDTRCCGIVLRVFSSIIPEFNASANISLASSIREFISSDVLKACITSLNGPYFVELQKEIAYVISCIIMSYSEVTRTPRSILLSLPGLQEESVDKYIDLLTRPGMQPKQQRALVLDLLGDLKGVSINEQGRITKSAALVRKERSKMQQEFMKEQPVERGQSPNLEGISGMFNP